MSTHPQERARECHRRDGVVLVQLGDQYALVDAAHERVVILNAAAASVWTRLRADDELVARHDAFLTALRRHGMLQSRPGPAIALPRIPLPPSDTPEILATAPLQVAANNSGDPFASSW